MGDKTSLKTSNRNVLSKGERTRLRIAQTAQKLFKAHGYEGVGIDTIMAEAGLTRGGFYAHFSNKAELLAAAMQVPPTDEENPVLVMPAGLERAKAFIQAYVNLDHAQDLEGGCPTTALAPEIKHGGLPARQVYQGVFLSMYEMLEESLSGSDAGDRASQILATCIGGLTVARAVADQALATRLLEQSREAALKLVH